VYLATTACHDFPPPILAPVIRKLGPGGHRATGHAGPFSSGQGGTDFLHRMTWNLFWKDLFHDFLQVFFILLQKQLEIDIIFSRFFDVFGTFHDLLMSALETRPMCVRSTFGAPRSCAEPQPFDSSDFHQFFHPFALPFFSCFFHFIIFYHILSYFVIFISIWLSWFTFIVFECHISFVSFSPFRATWRFIQFTWPPGQAWQLDLKRPCMAVSLAGFSSRHQFENRSHEGVAASLELLELETLDSISQTSLKMLCFRSCFHPFELKNGDLGIIEAVSKWRSGHIDSDLIEQKIKTVPRSSKVPESRHFYVFSMCFLCVFAFLLRFWPFASFCTVPGVGIMTPKGSGTNGALADRVSIWFDPK
jgi:hypothetical protein